MEIASLKKGLLKRESLWVQTKFTHLRGQDPERNPALFDFQSAVCQ